MGNRVNVYIKADNIISALGFDTRENLESIRNYRTGIALHTDRRIADTPIWAATIDALRLQKEVDSKGLNTYTSAEQLAILSISDVMEQSGTDLKDKTCGLILASTKGNIGMLGSHTVCSQEDISLWKMTQRIAGYFGREDDFHIISNACISGVSALIVAKRWIETGRYFRVVVTGVDVLSHFITSGFLSFKSVSRRTCRPYDKDRDGLSLGEGCGTILLSNEGNENDIRIAGGAISNDANHLSGPSRTGDGLYFAIHQAMVEAGLKPGEVDAINTHGTATIYNDEMEAKAIHLAGIENATVNSLKPYFGHTLGAAGVIETIVSAHELKEQVLFGTYGFNELGVSMPLHVSPRHEQRTLKTCIKTASGFGGCNAAIALTIAQETAYIDKRPPKATTKTITTVLIEKNTIIKDNKEIFHSDVTNPEEFVRDAYKAYGGNNLKFYQLSGLCKLGLVASYYLFDGITYQPGEAGIVMANANSSLQADMAHQHIINNSGDAAASPSIFVFTLPNVVTGEICIRNKIQGENTFFINKTCNFGELEDYARMAMEYGNLKYCIVGWCEMITDSYSVELRLLERRNE